MALAVLETDRLTLRPVQSEDSEWFEAFYADPEVMAIRKYGVLDAEAARKQVQGMLDHWAYHGFGMWVVEEKATAEAVGECGLRWREDGLDVELSYGFYPRFRGRGLATEAARAALDFGANELLLERIVALSRGDNVRSHKVLEKLGMTLEWRKQTGQFGLVRYHFQRQAPSSSQ